MTEEEFKEHAERVKRECERTKKRRKTLQLEAYTWVSYLREKEALSDESADIINLSR